MPRQVRRTATCTETARRGAVHADGAIRSRLLPGLVTHICSTTIELNINLTCIIMKLNMKTMVLHRRVAGIKGKLLGAHFWVDFSGGAQKGQGTPETVTRVSQASQPAPRPEPLSGADSLERFSLQSPLLFLGLLFAQLFRSYRSDWSFCVCVN